MSALRYWEYYNMTGIFTDLHERAKNKENFSRLYDIITLRENILLAYRTIKSNKGSKTAGTDGKTIDDIKAQTEEEMVTLIQKKLANYRPKKVRRVLIPKPNGKQRPLGIPCILDRIIQQCFKQILEPIAEAHFYKHNYGFRPMRTTHHAIARIQHLINLNRLYYIVDIDIKGFFDNVNHTQLMKQLWNMGIQDRKVLRIISKMLKAEIEGEGIPEKGTPQGGILSPLLSNIVLNDLDKWVAGQWEEFTSKHTYSRNDNKYMALKKTSLKEGYIVRYADDFKILCRDWKTAQKWYHAVKLYLQDRLKLDISPEKSQIQNLRKRPSEFLGFTIRAAKKGRRRVAHTGISCKKKEQLKKEAKERIRKISQSPSAKNALLFNSFVLGIHNYFNRATHVSIEFSRLARALRTFIYNRLKPVGKHEHPSNPPPTYLKYYNRNYKTFKIGNVYLFPLVDVKMYITANFNQTITPFTEEGRSIISEKLQPDIQMEISKLMKSNLPNRSVEYMDNRISRYSMRMGKCEITERFLYAENVHCHHYLPISLGGKDQFNNLRILHKDVHKIIHATTLETIVDLMKRLDLSKTMMHRVNQYRKKSNMELIDITS
ncbi:group II intron reverse transcriptase/maturase [Brevibacillus laterosporus]|uniref:Group II intron reverse transcriptase/maturase n=1 Tax=Brevibacillus laterosporus TaxID=1465 RepID=A0AAP3DLQ9_BRELA|nr:group II intron reverse transcriptase/maturase [Brevibacillus laterosporus]MCR8983322.1 group II intron reverse transcriptase/maturase [Brevibacillus laterosporus]MCZ0810478.1 group II intron reverse transcriptase/maturase [Brevibacillus laterosporus]MCZ0829054.1 group II intron reverse transcriptase/maturase [Brevibacillus laterosporus]MCZ0853185.1 group II intron reverse transcriptase/maturase [Brevibacillus laterosporus]